LCDRIDVARQEQGSGAHSAGSERSFNAGMPGATDDYVKMFVLVNHNAASFSEQK
jgi:hypothetical protein